MIKLCYKEYDYKLTLGAIKGFKKDTGEDILFILSKLLEVWQESIGASQRSRINQLYSVCDFELSAYAFYHLIKSKQDSIPLIEIEDAMFRVGVVPNNVDDEYCVPWPVVLVDLAYNIEQDFLAEMPAKK